MILRLCVEMGKFPWEWEPSLLDHERGRDAGLEMLLALAELEKDVCPGCGGWLSEELKPDHGWRFEKKHCTKCTVLASFQDKWAKEDQVLKGTNLAEEPSARRVFAVERLELPDGATVVDRDTILRGE